VRARLVAAAFELFEEQGYDATTTDQIAARAGTGRTTFFRAFGSKDEVALVDHATIFAACEAKLATAAAGTFAQVAREAAQLVLEAHVGEGALAKRRYRVLSQVPALRDGEVIIAARYQRMFYEHFQADPAVAEPLAAEWLAAAWVTTHNHVLRAWLAGRSKKPAVQLESALTDAYARLVHGRPDQAETAVIVFRTSADLEAVLPVVQAALSPAKPKRRPR
jgi:AcrR family transcriptional regulator